MFDWFFVLGMKKRTHLYGDYKFIYYMESLRLMATRNPGKNSPVEGLVVEIPLYIINYRVLAPSQVVGLGISEPSTVWQQSFSQKRVWKKLLLQTVIVWNPTRAKSTKISWIRFLSFFGRPVWDGFLQQQHKKKLPVTTRKGFEYLEMDIYSMAIGKTRKV